MNEQLREFYRTKKIFLFIGIGFVIAFSVVIFGAIQFFKKPNLPEKPPVVSDVGDDLSIDEENILRDLPLSASVKEKEDRYRLADKVSTSSDTISIHNCQGEPVVLSVKSNQPVIYINQDKVDHVIKIGTKTFLLEPQKITAVNPDFGNGVGLYGYLCDDSSETNGLILVKQ